MNIKKMTLLCGVLILQQSLSTLKAQTSEFSVYDKSGPYTAERVTNVGPQRAYDVFKPETLSPNGEKHAIITWGNGTGSTPTTYAGLLQHLATHGFVVVASHNTNTGTGKEMADGIEWLLEENTTYGSIYYQKLNPDVGGATGHSQGGAGTIEVLKQTDKITSIAPMAPATFTAPFFYSTTHVMVPAFIMAGQSDNLAQPALVKPASWGEFPEDGIGLYGEIRGVTHFEEVGDAGKFRKYNTAWFDATLNKNLDAIKMFFNTEEGALHKEPSEWSTLEYQNLDKYMVPSAAETSPAIGTSAASEIFPAAIQNNRLYLRIHSGVKYRVSFLTLHGVVFYQRIFSESGAITLTPFSTNGEFIIVIKNNRHIVFSQKMISLR
jgi:hypothetical protein